MSTYEEARYNFTGTNLVALNGSAITNGTVVADRIADLAASKITTGTFNDARLAASNITQHVDLSNLDASNLTSGTIPNARYGTPTFDGTNVTNTGETVSNSSRGIVNSNDILSVTQKRKPQGNSGFYREENFSRNP